MDTDVVLVNGSFGVGKTSVARRLRARLPGSQLYDPEWMGRPIRALARVVPLRGAGTDDFQDFALWRLSAVAGIRLFRALGRGPVLVPMAFYRLEYLTEIMDGLATPGLSARRFCLRASLAAIQARLRGRGDDPNGQWLASKVERCLSAHLDPRMGEAIDTEELGVDGVAAEILRRLSPGPPAGPGSARL